jgi:hypothetical protein
LGFIQETIPFAFAADNKKFDKDHNKDREMNLNSILYAEKILYIPSSDEIMRLEPLIKPSPGDTVIPDGDLINEELIDQQIKNLVKVPTLNSRYTQEQGLTRPLRKVGINEALCFNHSRSFKLLNFLTLLSRNL